MTHVAAQTSRGAPLCSIATPYALSQVPPLDGASSAGAPLVSVRGALTFEQLHFAYPTRPDAPVLRGVSFEVVCVCFAAEKNAMKLGGRQSPIRQNQRPLLDKP